MDYFYSVKDYISYKIKIKRSTFIAHLSYVETISEAKTFISSISAEHKNATHNCWAYIIGDKGEIFHASDSGEPSGTAGKPMLNALQKNKMANIAAVVTRYYGGVKLGIRGLIDAYGGTLNEAIESTDLKKIVDYLEFNLQLDYDFLETFKYNITKFGAEIINIDYSEIIIIKISIESPSADDLLSYLDELVKVSKIKKLDCL